MTKLVVFVGFFVAFAAGFTVGLRPRPAAPSPTSRPSGPGGWLAAELDLTTEQQEQLDRIWEDTAFRGRHDREEQRRALVRERDEAIVALIRPEDKPKYEALLEEYARRLDALEEEWKSAFQSAVEKTKEILTPEQRAKYEEIRKRHESDRGRPDRWRRDRDRDGGPGRGRDRRPPPEP